MKVLTHRPLPSAVMEMSTGSGTCAGSPIVATSRAAHLPPSAGLMSQSFEVRAAAVTAQFCPAASAQRISSGAPGTLSTWVGGMDFRFHTTTVLPNFFIDSTSLIDYP